MDPDRRKTHGQICPIDTLDPSHICQMLHVPRYHNIQIVENCQCHVHGIVSR
jgi:hypothetical protein